jgi:hypothetical protein
MMRYFVPVSPMALAIVSTAPAQNTTLTGRVRSAARKEPLPQTSVFVDASDTRLLTDSAGVFRIAKLRPGKHELRVRRLGFEDRHLDKALLTAGKTGWPSSAAGAVS